MICDAVRQRRFLVVYTLPRPTEGVNSDGDFSVKGTGYSKLGAAKRWKKIKWMETKKK